MDAKQAIKSAIDLGKMISIGYVADLTDEEMMHRPAEKCNHIKWQMGHLIQSENQMIEAGLPGSMPVLPEGFAEKYTKETASIDDADAFDSKEELMRLFDMTREATLKALANCPVDDLDQPMPEEMHAYAPTLGDAFNMQNSHWVMHAGQWAVIRRQLGREPLF